MFRRILLWFGGILVFSVLAFLGTVYWIRPTSPYRDDLRRRLSAFEANEAARLYESDGKPAAAAFLKRLDAAFPAQHFLLDTSGRDVIDGVNRAGQLPEGEGRPRKASGSGFFIRKAAANGRFILLMEMDPRVEVFGNNLIFGWIVLVIVLLCYALAWTLARPIQALRETVVRFGGGDLSSRAGVKRRDELGDLGRAFDQMADRMQTLLQAERRLLQDVSHELRSPLARLRFALELAKTSPTPGAHLERAGREVERLSTLVGELIQVTRAEGDPAASNVSAIDLKEFLATLIGDCRIEAEAAGCAIELTANGQSAWRGDRELLHRAVENILRNAIRFTPSGKAVEVSLTSSPEDYTISIRDFGPGVPEPMVGEIFQPFFRVEEDRNRETGGVGLGLAIADRAIRIHHGNIQASNRNPGLLVEIRLPRCE